MNTPIEPTHEELAAINAVRRGERLTGHRLAVLRALARALKLRFTGDAKEIGTQILTALRRA